MAPTSFDDLNELLQEFVASVRATLAGNFCGAYLVGSFALGEADEHSDVDFVVATHRELSDAEVDALQAMHRRLFALETPWAQHLEGSYIPKNALRRVDPARAEFWFLDNGSSALVRDSHCNTAVVRWSLRQHGIVLAGPEPKTLVDPVTPEQLRAEALWMLDEYARWVRREPEMSRWKQPYLVVTFCRILHTLESGRVSTKREASEWALEALDPDWAPLIRRSLDDRPDPWGRVHQQADPALVDRTLAFVDWCVATMALD